MKPDLTIKKNAMLQIRYPYGQSRPAPSRA